MSAFARKVSRAGRTALGLALKSPSDIYLASFPKSGNTWMKYVLACYVLNLDVDGRADRVSPPRFRDVDAIVPELGIDSHARGCFESRRRHGFRFVKTHLVRHGVLGRNPTLFVLRDPRRVMISYYAFSKANSRIRYQGDFSAFLRHPSYGLKAWAAHTRSWAVGSRIVYYEHLQRDTLGELDAALRDLLGTIDQEALGRAVSMGSRREMARLEREDPSVGRRQRKGYSFVGTEPRGDWDRASNAQDRYLLQEVIEELDRSHGHVLDRDWMDSLVTAPNRSNSNLP